MDNFFKRLTSFHNWFRKALVDPALPSSTLGDVAQLRRQHNRLEELLGLEQAE